MSANSKWAGVGAMAWRGGGWRFVLAGLRIRPYSTTGSSVLGVQLLLEMLDTNVLISECSKLHNSTQISSLNKKFKTFQTLRWCNS